MSFSVFLKNAKIILFIAIFIYAGRNIDRLITEYHQYDFNPFINQKFYHTDEIFKYLNWIYEREKDFSKINFLGKEFLITVPK